MPDHRPGPDWARIHGTEILDPDGWRAAGIPFDQPITLDEYNRLAATSTQRPARTPTEPAAELEQASGAPTELASPHRETGRAIRDAGGIPPGPWRVGSQCGRNLWIGPPRPDGVDVGRMDTDALAAHVVQAVNAYQAGADPTPRDEAAHWTPGQLWHRLTTATPDDRRRCLEHITEDLETAWNCRANAHDTTVTELRVAALRVGDLAAALREIVNTLGPDRVCTCTGPDCGIRTEAAEALRIAREALGQETT